MEMKKFEAFLYQASTADVERYVATQQLSKEEQLAVWKLDENCFIEALASNPCIIPQLQIRIATNSDFEFLWDTLAENKAICEKAQIVFAQKKNGAVRSILSQNENLCQKAASILLATNDVYVLTGLLYNVKMRENPWGHEIHEKIKNDPHYNAMVEREHLDSLNDAAYDEGEDDARFFQQLCDEAGVDSSKIIDAACEEYDN